MELEFVSQTKVFKRSENRESPQESQPAGGK